MVYVIQRTRRPSAPATPRSPRRAGGRRPDPCGRLCGQLQAVGIEGWLREFRFHDTRQWRIDIAWPHLEQPLAVEVEGGGFVQGRHSRGAGMRSDCEKYAELVLGGWRLLRVVGDQVNDGTALRWIERALGLPAPVPGQRHIRA